jgi:hypothetical protein
MTLRRRTANDKSVPSTLRYSELASFIFVSSSDSLRDLNLFAVVPLQDLQDTADNGC